MPPVSVAAVSAHLVDTRTYRAKVPFDNICRSCRRRGVHPPASSRPRQRVKLSVSVMALSEVTSPDPSDRAAVRDYVLGGPLIDQLSISRENATDDVVDRWTSVAARLCDQLSLEQASLDPAQASRVYRYYMPVYLWCLARLEAHRSASAPGAACPPLVVGLSAPQGCGKTTLVAQLTRLLDADGVRAASVSIDDVYLTGAEQETLANKNPHNPLLRFRGNAGSHDVALGVRTIESLKALNANPGSTTKVPRYDKTMRGGRGDRAPRDTWPTHTAPLHLVLLEGWMLGFSPVGDEAAAAFGPHLAAVNRELRRGGYDRLHLAVDDWVVVRVEHIEWVREWRLEAEREARAAGRGALTDDEVADFVDRFLPAYRAYLPGLYGDGPFGSQTGKVLTVRVDRGRNVLDV